MEYEKINKAADFIKSKINMSPTVGIILGSGLGDIAERIEDKTEIPYGEIPEFRCSTVSYHKGKLILGMLNGVYVICMQGRLHYYEGHSMTDIALPVRVMKLLGVKTLIVTNASGGVNESYKPGEIMLIEDHINFMGINPLIGKNIDELGPRCCDMTYAYTPSLRQIAEISAKKLSLKIKKGVYLGCTGPNFETPAEIRAFRLLGADAVGMSTVPEVITASHCGMNVLGFSLITNMAAGILDKPLTEQEVVEIGKEKGEALQKLIYDILGEITDK